MRRIAFDTTLASKIFESRQALLTLWGEKYGEKIGEYKDIILEVRTQTRESVLPRPDRLSRSCGGFDRRKHRSSRFLKTPPFALLFYIQFTHRVRERALEEVLAKAYALIFT